MQPIVITNQSTGVSGIVTPAGNAYRVTLRDEDCGATMPGHTAFRSFEDAVRYAGRIAEASEATVTEILNANPS